MVHVTLYIAALITIAVLDFLWLGVVAKSWYQSGIGHLMADKPNFIAAAFFYLLYPVGVVFFAALPALEGGQFAKAALFGALFGFFVYGTYDMTNMATLKDWPLGLALADIAWGTFVSAVGAVAAVLAHRWFH
jgi:uncharacterized membrane protein